MDVGARLTELRNAFGMSQYALWKRTGIAQGALSQYESGLKTPGVDTLERICEGFGITLADFFALKNEDERQRISLSSQEREVICCYRALNEARRKDVIAVLRTLARLEDEATP